MQSTTTLTRPEAASRSDDAGGQVTQTLQSKWYNIVTTALGADPTQFLLLQPSPPLGNTSDLLWAYFNNMPPRSLTASFNPSGGNQLYSDYRAVISQLNSQAGSTFKQDLGDYFTKWQTYLQGLNPMPTIEELPNVFQSWALVNANPRVAQLGATDLRNVSNDPIYRASLAVQDQSRFMNGVPNFSQTIEDLRSAIPSASSYSLNFDTATAQSNVQNTWAQGNIDGFYDLFSGSASSQYSALATKFAGSEVTIAGSFAHALRFVATPGSWYSAAALHSAYATSDNTMWQHGTPNWDTTFGPSGNMQYFTASLVVVDGIDLTITSSASYSSDEQKEVQANMSVGFWPFFSMGGSGGYSSSATFNDKGQMQVRITNPPGNPVVLGANVVSAAQFLGSNQLKPRLAMAGMASALYTSGVPAQSEMRFPGRAQGYVLRIAKQQWNHPVTYVIRRDDGAVAAAGRVIAGTQYSEDIVIPQNMGFTVINVGVWPLTVSHP